MKGLPLVGGRWGDMPLLFPIGWYRSSSGTPDCAAASFLNDTYHILISGQSRIGKDNLAIQIMLALALREPPSRVQFCIIDGKGLDYVGLVHKAHVWRLATDVRDIKPAMDALAAERERRGRVLRAAGVSAWWAQRHRRNPGGQRRGQHHHSRRLSGQGGMEGR